MNFSNFNDLITNKSKTITEIYISDLHLTYDEHSDNALFHAFMVFLEHIATLPDLKKLYILGDWFDVWIGDDLYLRLTKEEKPTHWITRIVDKLKAMRLAGCHIFIMVGNRDFLMKQPFCNTFMGELITEPFYIKIGDTVSRLEHGDAFCTDDKAYQRFRKYSRKPFVQWWLLRKKLHKRQEIADKIRIKSQSSNAKKSVAIMDVNDVAVATAFAPSANKEFVKQCRDTYTKIPQDCQIIIHGHTHKPAIHDHTTHSNSTAHNQNTDNLLNASVLPSKTRYVLGDWRIEHSDDAIDTKNLVTAVIGVVYHDTDTSVSTHNLPLDTFEMFEFSVDVG